MHAGMRIDAVRPLYEAAKPALRHYIDTSTVDRALTSYDSIRRSLK